LSVGLCEGELCDMLKNKRTQGLANKHCQKIREVFGHVGLTCRMSQDEWLGVLWHGVNEGFIRKEAFLTIYVSTCTYRIGDKAFDLLDENASYMFHTDGVIPQGPTTVGAVPPPPPKKKNHTLTHTKKTTPKNTMKTKSSRYL
jgi:hypothetical protein